MSSAPTVSVAVPTYARRELARQTVAQLLLLPSQPLEIIVVEQGADGQPPCGLEESGAGRVRWLHLPEPSANRARNVALREARGEIILYLDDDVRIDSNLVAEHAHCYRDGSVVAVAGRVRPGAPSPHANGGRIVRAVPMWSCPFDAAWDWDQVEYVDHCPGGNMSARADRLRRAGGFDERFSVGAGLLEETDASLRLARQGGRIVFCPSASLVHLAAGSGGNRVMDPPRYLWSVTRNWAYFLRKHATRPQQCTSLLRMGIFVASYGVRRRALTALPAAWRGLWEGLRLSSRGEAGDLPVGQWERNA